jgi:hypothetical protein
MRVFCVSAALSVAMAISPARAADRDTEEALELDQAIQVLKDEALQFNRDAQAAEEDFSFPPHTRVTIYISVDTAALLLKSVALDIDGSESLAYEYSDADARALLKSKGMQKLGRFNVSKGSHRLHAEFVARYADADPGDASIVDRFDVVFDKSHTPVDLELIVGKASRGSKPVLRLREWRAAK